jgi:anti-sigma B factor antagonist
LRSVEEVRPGAPPVHENGRPPATARLVVVGRLLDITTAPDLKAELLATLDAGVSRLVVEIERGCQIDSTGLAVLVAVQKRMLRAGGRFVVVIRDAHIAYKLQTLGLDRVLTIAGSRREAFAQSALG